MQLHRLIFLIQLILISATAYGATEPDSIPIEERVSIVCTKGVALIKDKKFAEARRCFAEGAALAINDSTLFKKCVRATGNAYYIEGMQEEINANLHTATDSYTKAYDSFVKADAYKDQVLAIRRIAALNDLKLKQYNSALPFYQDALAIAERHGLTQLRGQLLIDLILLRDKQNAWVEKNELNLALDTLLADNDSQPLRFQRAMLNGSQASRRGRLKKAESFYKQAIDQIDPENPGSRYHEAYFKLRDNAIKMKRYDKALEYGEKCVDIFRQGFKATDPHRYRPFGGQAEIYAKLNDRDNCFRCADSLFKMQEADPNLHKLTKTDLYIQRGEWHMAFGEYEAAVSDFSTALDLLKECDPKAALHRRLSTLLLLANATSNSGNKNEAKNLYRLYTGLCETTYGHNSKKHAEALGFLANIEAATGEKEIGSKHYMEAAGIMLNAARQELRLAPSSDREAHWNDISSLLWAMASYAVTNGLKQDSFTRLAYDALLFSKGLLLASEKSWESAIYSSGDKEIIESYQRFLSLKNKLAERADDNSQERYYAEMNAIDHRLTKELLDRGFSDPIDSLNFNDIAAALKPGELVVDFADYWLPGDKRQYVAYLIKEGWEHPLLLPITTSDSIDSILRSTNGHPDRLYLGDNAHSILKAIWRPIAAYAGASDVIYFIPSGAIHHIALSSIPTDDGATLGQKHEIIRLTSAKEILNFRRARSLSNPHDAALFGDIDYDIAPQEMAAASRRHSLPQIHMTRGYDMFRGDSTFKKLPCSAEEVTEIGKILAHNNVKVSYYTKTDGTEEAFMQLSGQSPELLLLSTHGFYYTPADIPSHTSLAGYDDIMYLTGLTLAGGNAEWTGKELPEGVMGGLLTSEDISRLDLSSTQLVVLSACETGRGQEHNDGLYGLQRAFKKAGAQTLVMSLWQVSDLVSKEFMISFFRNLPTSGWNKRTAFESAKAEIRTAYPDPFYWAGFVMVD